MAWFLALVAALFLIGIIVVPPLRRAFLLRHLERPMWPVSPTSRVMNLWRRALAALALLEIEPGAGEAPLDFARRARGALAARGCDAAGLEEAAGIVEKVDYAGRGLGKGDEEAMRAAVMGLVRAVGAQIGAGKKLSAAWGPAPEVEEP